MVEQAPIMVDTETRRRALAEALTIQIDRRAADARRYRHTAQELRVGGKADALRSMADEQDRMREMAEAIREEFL